jgi:hypothetical protein
MVALDFWSPQRLFLDSGSKVLFMYAPSAIYFDTGTRPASLVKVDNKVVVEAGLFSTEESWR